MRNVKTPTRGAGPPKKGDKIIVLFKMSTGPPKKVGRIIVPLFHFSVKSIQAINNQSFRGGTMGTMWNNHCSTPK
jgi:hypothetical protein